MSLDDFIAALLAAPNAHARRELLNAEPHFVNPALIQKLKDQADQAERDDARKALNIGCIAQEIAEGLKDEAALALALWTQANAYEVIGEYESAVKNYEQAAALFRKSNHPIEAARTSIGHIAALMYLGQLEAALTLAASARETFAQEGDALSQAKIDMNMGNLYDQSGKPALALESFQRAIAIFESLGEALYAAMSKVNAGIVLCQLDQFLEAEDYYAQARPIFESAGLQTAVAILDRDIAGLQSARGHYAEAFRTLERARTAFTALGMEMKIAEMDLNESDLYLNLNLPRDALRLAEKAEQTFVSKGLSFELARARANRAIALARLKPTDEAVRLLSQARDLFQAVNNEIWATHAELQRAEVLGRSGVWDQAYALLTEVANQYQRLGLKTKRAYANIASTEWLIHNQQWAEAITTLQEIRSALNGLSMPWLGHRIEAALGRVYEGLGSQAEAIQHYQLAVEQLESMAAAISAEEHRTAFVTDKTAPYEALVSLLASEDAAQALAWAERAKSRALVDLLAGRIRPQLQAEDTVDAARVASLQTLREELNWMYSRLTHVAIPDDSGPPIAGPEIWPRIREKEGQVMALWHDLQAKHAESLSLEHVSPPAPNEIQQALPQSTVLIEYFIARNQVMAFVISRDRISAYPALVALPALQPLLEELAFQLSKFQYGPAYYQRHSAALYESAIDILDQLYRCLIAPLWSELVEADSLIIVPHGPLHSLPFHALYRDGEPLAKTHAISYAPSIAVLQFCWQKKQPIEGTALLLGIPDESIPNVAREVQSLAQQLPNSVTLLKDAASYARLRDLASRSRILHLATHGIFRPDAPLLSGVRLADRWLTAQDVYELDLGQASLVTLSACESGLGQVAGGDDVVGLVRGFLYAGAASLLVSLWQVADDTMTDLMDAFYKALLSGEGKARALRKAQQAVIETHPHPYFWAPLVLVGNER